MPVGPADNQGTVLYYDDSGVPGGSVDYVTIILVHGAVYHSAIFRNMIPHAVSNNLRLILLNLRDYPGSTRYSPAELEALASPDKEVQTAAIEARGMELATFIRWFIETERIPPITDDLNEDGRPSGGIALLGWSAGNWQTISMIACAKKLPVNTRNILDVYFRTFFIYDTSQTTLGMSPLEGLYHPFRDESLTKEEKMARFPAFISSYFTQSVIDQEDFKSPEFIRMLLARKVVHSREGDSDSYHDLMPTTQRMSPDQLAEVADQAVMWRSQHLFQRIDLSIYQENFRAAILGCDSERESIIWPRLRVHWLWCDMTISDAIYCVIAAKNITEQNRQSQRGRQVEFRRIENANHFFHWDEPKRFTKLLASIV